MFQLHTIIGLRTTIKLRCFPNNSSAERRLAGIVQCLSLTHKATPCFHSTSTRDHVHVLNRPYVSAEILITRTCSTRVLTFLEYVRGIWIWTSFLRMGLQICRA